MEKQYLDYNGLANVAGYVNTRLKTVTTMPVSADNGAVRLYVGTSGSTYEQGHIYQYNSENTEWVDITPVGSGGGSGTGDMQTSVYDANGDVANAGGIADYVEDAISENVEANPSGTATDTLTKLKVDNTIYGIDSGGSITPKVLASVTSDGVMTYKNVWNALYQQLLPISFDKLIGTVLVTGATCFFLSRLSVNDQEVEYSTEYTLTNGWGTHDVDFKSSNNSTIRIIVISGSNISYGTSDSEVPPSGRIFQIVKPSAYVATSGVKNLLWTNSNLNPTVANVDDTFPATNSIPQVRNDQGYDYFIIVFRNHACRLMEVNYLLYPDQNDPNYGRVMVAVSTAYNGTAWKSCRRQFGFWNTGSAINTLYCTAGGEIASDGSMSEDNHYLIPYKIYGVKL